MSKSTVIKGSEQNIFQLAQLAGINNLESRLSDMARKSNGTKTFDRLNLQDEIIYTARTMDSELDYEKDDWYDQCQMYYDKIESDFLSKMVY